MIGTRCGRFACRSQAPDARRHHHGGPVVAAALDRRECLPVGDREVVYDDVGLRAKLRAPDAPMLATAVLERRKARWRVVTFGIAGFPFKGVPERVLNDLLGATLCDCY